MIAQAVTFYLLEVTSRLIRAVFPLVLAVLLVSVWIQRRSILDWAARFLVLSEPPQRADLALVLGGDFYGPRVFRGVQLGDDGYAPVVLISGATYQGRPEGEWAIEYLAARGHKESFYAVFGHHARSTIEEAVAVCPELNRRSAKRVLLVTSSYHSRRANIVFRLFCPGVEYISVPGTDPHYDPSRYTTDPSSRALFKSEWEKIFGTLFLAYPQYLLNRLKR